MAHQLPQQFVPSIPRPADLDDDASVPNPEVGGLTFMWSQANTLTRSMSRYLLDLQAEYASALNGHMADLVNELIDRFQTETRIIEQVRRSCCRKYHFSTLGSIPPYQYTVLTLRTHLNCWLKMWREHQKHKQSGLAEGTNDGDDNEGKDKSQPIPHLAQHLKNWLAAIDKLPRYPETFPEYPTIGGNQAHVGFVPAAGSPTLQIEECTGPEKTVDNRENLNRETPNRQEPNRGQPSNILDHRSHARKVADLRARDRCGSVPKPPYPGVSLIAEGLKKARQSEDGGNSV
ncbi:hypothetical protein NKR19_g10218 [Coniochaeta hoffmannii]|uniref:Uncharacterized protein n=1 Tax=Coniochaeta hoffmannii TaxID=91930 RepID=A0AA38R204_9PEZI|nr:hypothetical protein NKR19_g10218 [Coniochaeta hoffmannii]